MLTGPSPRQKGAGKAGMRMDRLDLWELNEAFAAVVLRFMEVLKCRTTRST